MLVGLGGEQRWKSAENARMLETGMLTLTTGGQVHPAPSSGRAGAYCSCFLWEDTDRSANWVCDCLVEELTSFEFFLGGRVLCLWEDAELGFFSVEVERHILKLSVLKFMNLFHLTF